MLYLKCAFIYQQSRILDVDSKQCTYLLRFQFLFHEFSNFMLSLTFKLSLTITNSLSNAFSL